LSGKRKSPQANKSMTNSKLHPTIDPMRISLFLISTASLFIFAACGEKGGTVTGSPEDPPAAAPASWPATQASDGGNFEVTIEPEGAAIVRNKHFAIDVKLVAISGDTEGVSVKVDGDMPAHGHGMNTKPEFSAIDGGGHRAEGMLFHMGGDWVITVDVMRDGKSEKAAFPVSVE
jgi:hypothetical protein